MSLHVYRIDLAGESDWISARTKAGAMKVWRGLYGEAWNVSVWRLPDEDRLVVGDTENDCGAWAKAGGGHLGTTRDAPGQVLPDRPFFRPGEWALLVTTARCRTKGCGHLRVLHGVKQDDGGCDVDGCKCSLVSR